MKECRYCRTTYDDNLMACPSCGANKVVTPREQAERYALQQNEEANTVSSTTVSGVKKGRIIGIIAAATVAVVLIIAVASAIGRGSRPNTINPSQSGSSAVPIIDIDSNTENPTNTPEPQATEDISPLIQRANALYSESDKKEFIEFVNSNKSALIFDSGIMSKYDSAVNEYRDGIMSDAQTAFNNNGYEAAVNIINNGLSVLKQDAILLGEKSRYLTYQPIALTDLEPFYKGAYVRIGPFSADWGFESYDYSENNYGDKYNPETVICAVSRSYSVLDRTIEYNLACEYSVLRGTYYVLRWARQTPAECFSSTSFGVLDNPQHPEGIKIYADDILIYSISLGDGKADPIEFEIDITGVDFLKIELYGNSNGGSWAEAAPFCAIAECTLAKTP